MDSKGLSLDDGVMSSYNVENDITIEFYYKFATYKSPVTGEVTEIKINRVHFEMETCGQYPYWEKKILIRSSQGVEYLKDELTNFRINI